MEKREKIAVYEKLLSDPDLTEAQRETIAKLLAKEKGKDGFRQKLIVSLRERN
jgi:hypothetical protein